MPFLPFTDEELQELATKFPRIEVVRGKTPARARWAKPGDPEPEPPYELVFRSPTTGESDAFEGAAHDAKAQPGALRTLAKATVVAVSYRGIHSMHDGERKGKAEREVREAWDKLRTEFPGVHMAAQEVIKQLNGMAQEEQGKD